MPLPTESAASDADKTRPWWRYPIVWLVIAGPAIVVVASVITMGLAMNGADPVLDTSASQVARPSQAPAVRARNHAASPEQHSDQK
jgi:hypothetical protein